MRGCRQSGVRVIIPPNCAQQPMRITCRYLRRERLVHPPPLLEGEACASKIVEVGPVEAKFLRPVVIEVPHFASLCVSDELSGDLKPQQVDRQIIVLRSDNGQVWREHSFDCDSDYLDALIRYADRNEQQVDDEDVNDSSTLQTTDNTTNKGAVTGATVTSTSAIVGSQQKRLTRIVTNEFPHYFAIISRIKQDIHSIEPSGAILSSSCEPQIRAILPEGALTKKTKIGLQVSAFFSQIKLDFVVTHLYNHFNCSDCQFACLCRYV